MKDDLRTTISRAAIDDVKPDITQPRRVISDKHINELAINIQTVGMINPLELDATMTIITGNCRWLAAKKAGWTEVPVIINSASMTPYERLRRQLSENVLQSGADKSEQMNPADTAKGLARLAILKAYNTIHTVRPANDLEKKSFPEATKFKDEHRLYQAISAYSNKELLEVYRAIPPDAKNGLIGEIIDETGIKKTTIWELLGLLDQPEFVVVDIQEGRPRTFYREADKAPEEVREKIKEKIAKGDYRSREEIIHDVSLAKEVPEVAQLELARHQTKESTKTNKILNSIVRLGLALESQPIASVEEQEKGIVRKQLEWIRMRIDEYLLAE